jgi:Tfp pilus assembly protein PilO
MMIVTLADVFWIALAGLAVLTLGTMFYLSNRAERMDRKAREAAK